MSDHTWFKAAGRNDEETSLIVTYPVIVTACAASFVIIAIVRTFNLIESYIQIPLLFSIYQMSCCAGHRLFVQENLPQLPAHHQL